MNKRKLVVLHLLFWLLLFIKNSFVELTGSGLSFITNPPSGWRLHLIISISYFFIPVVIFYWSLFAADKVINTRFNLPGKIVFSVLILTIPVLARAIVEFGFLKPFIGYDNYKINTNFSWSYFIANALFYYWDIILFGIAYSIFMHWRKAETQRQKLAALHKTTELEFLRSQLNPHFLFNSINDIYSLVLKKNDEAAEALLQLSGILRYALYESNHSEVSLEKELSYIRNYLDLQKTGYDGNFFSVITITGEIQNRTIAPMLLLPFIENSCKHGITNDQAFPIKISLDVLDSYFQFRLANNIGDAQKDAAGGIGLGNIKKRLMLIYPGKHELIVTNDQTTFTITLRIDK